MKKTKEYKVQKFSEPYWFLTPTLIVLLVLMVYPILKVFYYSFFDNVITNPNPNFVGFSNYKAVLSDKVFQSALGHTLYFTIFSVVFHMIIGLSLAMLLNAKINPIFRSFSRLVMVLPWLFTATVIAIIWKLILDPGGIINYILQNMHVITKNIEWFGNEKFALRSLTFANIWAGYPLYMVSILASLQAVPQDEYEAALIDGTNGWQSFWYITIPHLIPVILSLSMLDFIWTMQVFPLVWTTTGGGPGHATEMLSTYTYKQTFHQYEFSMASTSAVIIFIVSLLLSIFYSKKQK